jgi:hypothetical protein
MQHYVKFVSDFRQVGDFLRALQFPPKIKQYFSYIVAVRFIGGGNRNAKRKPLTCRKSLISCIT